MSPMLGIYQSPIIFLQLCEALSTSNFSQARWPQAAFEYLQRCLQEECSVTALVILPKESLSKVCGGSVERRKGIVGIVCTHFICEELLGSFMHWHLEA